MIIRHSNTVLSVMVESQDVTTLVTILPASIVNKLLFLWTGTINGNELVNDLDNNNLIIVGKDFTGPKIPVGSSADFMIPDLSVYKNADTDTLESIRRGDLPATGDTLWTDGSGNLQQVSVNDLIAYDYKNTLIKYSNQAPHDISWIAIKNPNTVFTRDEINILHNKFLLWVYWAGGWNIYGQFKYNRLL